MLVSFSSLLFSDLWSCRRIESRSDCHEPAPFVKLHSMHIHLSFLFSRQCIISDCCRHAECAKCLRTTCRCDRQSRAQKRHSSSNISQSHQPMTINLLCYFVRWQMSGSSIAPWSTNKLRWFYHYCTYLSLVSCARDIFFIKTHQLFQCK